MNKPQREKISYYRLNKKRKRFQISLRGGKLMEKLLEKGLQRVKQFYIEQLVKTGNYQPKDNELFSMTISELKYIYQQEAISQPKRPIVL